MSAVLTLPLAAIAGLLIAYLLGSIPTGYLAGRLRGIDIRQHGSKSTGATNALRTLGKGPALVVLIVDVAKGAAAVLFANGFYVWLLSASPDAPVAADGETFRQVAVCICGLAALVGHARPVWLNFVGGSPLPPALAFCWRSPGLSA
jgi:glycerol-3-phosphate acyltransferase PlsY